MIYNECEQYLTTATYTPSLFIASLKKAFAMWLSPVFETMIMFVFHSKQEVSEAVGSPWKKKGLELKPNAQKNLQGENTCLH